MLKSFFDWWLRKIGMSRYYAATRILAQCLIFSAALGVASTLGLGYTAILMRQLFPWVWLILLTAGIFTLAAVTSGGLIIGLNRALERFSIERDAREIARKASTFDSQTQ